MKCQRYQSTNCNCVLVPNNRIVADSQGEFRIICLQADHQSKPVNATTTTTTTRTTNDAHLCCLCTDGGAWSVARLNRRLFNCEGKTVSLDHACQVLLLLFASVWHLYCSLSDIYSYSFGNCCIAWFRCWLKLNIKMTINAVCCGTSLKESNEYIQYSQLYRLKQNWLEIKEIKLLVF